MSAPPSSRRRPAAAFAAGEATAVTLDWRALSRAGLALRACASPVRVGGCDWIDDESIRECLWSGHLEDVSQPLTAASHHAARIASLVRLLTRGIALDPIRIAVTPRRVLIFDGSHLLRAYEFARRLHRVPALVCGDLARLAPFVVESQPRWRDCPYCGCSQPEDHLKCDDCAADLPVAGSRIDTARAA